MVDIINCIIEYYSSPYLTHYFEYSAYPVNAFDLLKAVTKIYKYNAFNIGTDSEAGAQD